MAESAGLQIALEALREASETICDKYDYNNRRDAVAAAIKSIQEEGAGLSVPAALDLLLSEPGTSIIESIQISLKCYKGA